MILGPFLWGVRKLVEDLDRLHCFIVRFAQGERHLKQERDRLEGSVQVKLALLGDKEEPADTA